MSVCMYTFKYKFAFECIGQLFKKCTNKNNYLTYIHAYICIYIKTEYLKRKDMYVSLSSSIFQNLYTFLEELHGIKL